MLMYFMEIKIKSSFRTLSLLVVTILLFSFKGTEKDISNITSAFSSGSSNELTQYLDEKVELSFRWNNTREQYSKVVAISKLKKFFTENPSDNFSIVHKGGSKDLKYFIGLYSSEDKTYRVYCLMKKQAEEYKISEIEFSIKP